MKKLYRNAKRFVQYCQVQYRLEQDQQARVNRKRQIDEARRREALEAIRDGCS